MNEQVAGNIEQLELHPLGDSETISSFENLASTVVGGKYFESESKVQETAWQLMLDFEEFMESSDLKLDKFRIENSRTDAREEIKGIYPTSSLAYGMRQKHYHVAYTMTVRCHQDHIEWEIIRFSDIHDERALNAIFVFAACMSIAFITMLLITKKIDENLLFVLIPIGVVCLFYYLLLDNQTKKDNKQYHTRGDWEDNRKRLINYFMDKYPDTVWKFTHVNEYCVARRAELKKDFSPLVNENKSLTERGKQNKYTLNNCDELLVSIKVVNCSDARDGAWLILSSFENMLKSRDGVNKYFASDYQRPDQKELIAPGMYYNSVIFTQKNILYSKSISMKIAYRNNEIFYQIYCNYREYWIVGYYVIVFILLLISLQYPVKKFAVSYSFLFSMIPMIYTLFQSSISAKINFRFWKAEIGEMRALADTLGESSEYSIF